MENILQKFLVSDSNVIQQGTKELKEAFKRPEAIAALCEVLVSSGNGQIRQTAAVVLRRKLGKRQQWNKLDLATRTTIKQGMLQALINEQEKLVKNAIAQFIGLVGKFELDDWPEIFTFLEQYCRSEDLVHKELGMYTLSIMTETSKISYIKYADFFTVMFTSILANPSNENILYYTVLTMNNLVGVIEGHQQLCQVYNNSLPKILEVIMHFGKSDEKRGCELFEILDNLIECNINVIVPHIQNVVKMCLEIANDKELSVSVRIKAVSVIGWLIRSKSKVVQKNKLIEPILDVLILLMAAPPDDDVNEEYFLDNPDEFTCTTIAAQTLDLVAIHVPPEKVVPYLLKHIETALQGQQAYVQKAAYLALAVLAEGCADYIRGRYLELFLRYVYDGMKSGEVVARNAAFFALGQFSEHLQPEISQYAPEILPVLFGYLTHLYSTLSTTTTEPSGLDRLFYALQSYCLHLDDSLLPYLPELMDRLLAALEPSSWSIQLKRSALGTLDCVTCAIKDSILPYFERIVRLLMVYINVVEKKDGGDESDLAELQPPAIECLATLAANVSPEHFKPLAGESLQMAMKIMDGTDDPDIRKSVYALVAALSIVMKEELVPVLPTIVEHMITTLKSTEGIVAHCEDDDREDLDVYEDLSDSEGEIDIDCDNDSDSSSSSNYRYTVENSYNDEKEQACMSLTEMSKNIGIHFLPFLDACFEEIFKLVNYPREDIRSAAILTLEQFCVTLGESTNEVSTENSTALEEQLQLALRQFVPKCAELIRADEEHEVVRNAINALGAVLEGVGSRVMIAEGHREAIMNCVVDLLNQRTLCQDTDTGGAGGDVSGKDGDVSEQMELLMECAGDVIPKFGNAVTPEEFSQYFPNVFKMLALRMGKDNTVSQRSFSFGTLAECMKPLGVYIQNYTGDLNRYWNLGCGDSNDEVRNNAVFGLGEMVLHGKEYLFPLHIEILQKLSELMSREQHAGTMDNICGAVAKLIIVNHSNLPMNDIFPVLLQHLPLKTDFQENEAIVKTFITLYQAAVPIFGQHINDIIKITAHIFHNKETANDETKDLLAKLLQQLNTDFPQEFSAIVPLFVTN